MFITEVITDSFWESQCECSIVYNLYKGESLLGYLCWVISTSFISQALLNRWQNILNSCAKIWGSARVKNGLTFIKYLMPQNIFLICYLCSRDQSLLSFLHSFFYFRSDFFYAIICIQWIVRLLFCTLAICMYLHGFVQQNFKDKSACSIGK